MIGVPLGCAAFAGVGTCLIARRDFTRKVTWWATAVCAALVGVVSLFVLYLSVLAFLGTAAVHLGARRLAPRAEPGPCHLGRRAPRWARSGRTDDERGAERHVTGIRSGKEAPGCLFATAIR
ncbi:hypothetical protein ACFPZI_30520 [Streptomyces chlorus]|uniref:Uncharacterized protein n=1 Tax=Streptomyces chlorus TaxID=887452 RepID=A0ABW1E572_9ACTN